MAAILSRERLVNRILLVYLVDTGPVTYLPQWLWNNPKAMDQTLNTGKQMGA